MHQLDAFHRWLDSKPPLEHRILLALTTQVGARPHTIEHIVCEDPGPTLQRMVDEGTVGSLGGAWFHLKDYGIIDELEIPSPPLFLLNKPGREAYFEALGWRFVQ